MGGEGVGEAALSGALRLGLFDALALIALLTDSGAAA